ncbi:MAG: B12-binding domain-containing radical SAM protein, partial [Clostridia bacterium]|nr:B12-binding domain-containing radical SAM protein [Clostridia bacterium]
VLLINPAVGFYDRTMSTPLGLLSIGSYLKHYGHTVRLYDRCVDKTKLKTVLKQFSPAVVGISVMSSRGLKDAIQLSKEFKDRGLTVVWGGQLPSLQPDLVIQKDYVDIVSLGEGEETWLELIDCFSGKQALADVLGIVYKKSGEIIRRPCRPFSDLGAFPPTDWSLIDVPKYMQTYIGCKKMMYLYSSKGCPGRCAFCPNVTYHQSTHRNRPNEQVIEEIRYLYEHYGLDGVYFSDEVWRTKRSDLQDFCRRMMEAKLPVQWGVDLRIGLFNEEDYRLMYQAGCRWIFFGIETGSREMQRLIHKNIPYEKIKPTIELLNQIGFTTMSSFIVGFPDETEDQLRETAKMLNEIPIGLSPIFHFTPLPGTELYDRLVAEGRCHEPEKLEDLLHVVATENLGTNYSRVPDTDLKVIRNWYHWKSFTNKNAIQDSKPFEFARQTIQSTLSVISRNGFSSLFINGFSAANEFLYVFYYSHMFPGVKKKYGLK